MTFRFPIGYDVSFEKDGEEIWGQVVDRRESGDLKVYTIQMNDGKKHQVREEELQLYYFDENLVYVVQFSDGKFLEYGANGEVRKVTLKNADKWHFKWHAEDEVKELKEKVNDELRVRSVELTLK